MTRIVAGPAGVSVAHGLAITDHQVTAFEAISVPGGNLPLGIELKLNTPIGPDRAVADLRVQIESPQVKHSEPITQQE